MESWKTPLGLKVSQTTISDIDMLFKMADVMKSYHGGSYVIGRDSKYCDSPHYHIHFWSVKSVTKDALKVFKSKNLLKQFNLKRSDKMYTGQDLPSADKLAWLGYALKEEIISVVGFSDDIQSQIIQHAGVQLEIKKLKKIKSESIQEKEKEKKMFKDKMFDYIKTDYNAFCDKHENELLHKYDTKNGIVIPSDDRYIIKCMIVQYLMDSDRYGSIRKVFIDNYYKEYCGRYLGKSCFEIFDLIN